MECLAWAPDSAHGYLSEPVINGTIEGKFSSTTLYLVSGARDKTIRLWDVINGLCLYVFVRFFFDLPSLRITLFPLQTGHDNWIRALHFHPSGKFLLSSSDDKTLRIWEMKTKRNTKTLDAHSHFCTSLDMHRTKPYVISGSVDTTIKVWECR